LDKILITRVVFQLTNY